MLGRPRRGADPAGRLASAGRCACHVQFFSAVAGSGLGPLLLALVLLFDQFADPLLFALPFFFLGLAFGCLFLGFFLRCALGLFLARLLFLFLGNLASRFFSLQALFLLGFETGFLFGFLARLFFGLAAFLGLLQGLLDLLALGVILFGVRQGFALDEATPQPKNHKNTQLQGPRARTLDTQFADGLAFQRDLARRRGVTFGLAVRRAQVSQ